MPRINPRLREQLAAQPRTKRQKTTTSNVTTASRGATIVARRSPRVELKRSPQLPVSAVGLGNVWLMYPFGEIAVGDDQYTRDGRACRHQYTQWALRLTKNPAYADTQVRMIILAWKQALNTPQPIDVISDISGVLATVSTYQIDASENYTILEDKIITLTSHSQAIGGGSFGECIRTVDGVFNYNRIQTYNGNLATDVSNFRYYVILVSQFASSVSDVRFQTATTFTDV